MNRQTTNWAGIMLMVHSCLDKVPEGKDPIPSDQSDNIPIVYFDGKNHHAISDAELVVVNSRYMIRLTKGNQ